MKILAIIGSPKGKESTEFEVLNDIQTNLNVLTDTLDIINLSEMEITDSDGSGNEFYTGKSLLNDDVHLIEEKMNEADVLILSSPVYAHAISAHMKRFIDRISYWMHLFKLSGKFGYILSVSSNNGNDKVNDYLRDIMEYLGLSIIGETSIRTADICDENALKSYSRYIYNQLKFNKATNISFEQEKKFNTFKTKFSLDTSDTVERKYWIENDMINYKSFEEYFNSRIKNED